MNISIPLKCKQTGQTSHNMSGLAAVTVFTVVLLPAPSAANTRPGWPPLLHAPGDMSLPIKLKNGCRTSTETSRILIDLGFLDLVVRCLMSWTVYVYQDFMFFCACISLCQGTSEYLDSQNLYESYVKFNVEITRTGGLATVQLGTKSACLMHHCLNQNQYGTASGACSNGWLRPSWCKCAGERASNSIVVVDASILIWNVPILPSFHVMQVSTCHTMPSSKGTFQNALYNRKIGYWLGPSQQGCASLQNAHAHTHKL